MSAGGSGLALDPHRHGLKALEQHPGIERRQRRSGLANERVDIVLDEFLGREDHAAEATPLPVDMLGRRIDDAIGAEFERALIHRRREHVVDHERGAGVMRDPGDRFDIDHFQRRIGRALEKERLGIRPHRLAPLLQIGAVDQRAGNAVARQEILDHVAARSEQCLRRDDMIAGLELAEQRDRHRRHAGRGRARGLRAFERGHALLEHRNRRIGEARILIAGRFALETRLGGRGILVDITLREKQRFGGFPKRRAQRAGMNQPRFRAPGVGALCAVGGRRHHGLLWPIKIPAGKNPSAGLLDASPAF